MDRPPPPITFSVCIPVWNDVRWLPGAVESVINQSHASWELVISDNASDEDLAAIVASYADRRIRHVRWPDHVGTYENHNRAVSLCSYDWLVPIGSDDRMAPDALAIFADRIRALAAQGLHPTMVLAACRRVDSDGRPAGRDYYGSRGTKVVRSGVYQSREWLEIMAQPGVAPWNIGSIAFSRRALIDSGGAFRPEVGLSADTELVLRLSAYGPVAYIDKPLADYTVRSDSDGNRRFAANRSRGEPHTPGGAALASGLAVHLARGVAGDRERRVVMRAIARLHLQRAGQHRILQGGHGRRGALQDVWRAVRHWPGVVASPRQLTRAIATVVAPAQVISRVSARLSQRGQ